jgi:transglutaminase-like putative cysteine protease
MKKYLCPTYFIESDHPLIRAFAEKHSRAGKTDIEKAVSVYYAVRDGIRYNPYSIEYSDVSMKASTILARGEGYCVAKAVVLAACLRSQEIPARLGFADIKNHLSTQRLRKLMGTDIFIYHGFTEIFLNGKWLKATPAFNLSLCTKVNVKPVEFDGINDSILHPYNNAGEPHIEYVKDRGVFADLPWDIIAAKLKKYYPMYDKHPQSQAWDFHAEAEAETENQPGNQNK